VSWPTVAPLLLGEPPSPEHFAFGNDFVGRLEHSRFDWMREPYEPRIDAGAESWAARERTPTAV
jgi:hypothetical protein